MTAVDRLIAVARADIGVTESPPGSNRTKYGAAYGWDGVPWCVEFLWYIFTKARLAYAFFGGAKTASCGTLLQWYKAGGMVVAAEEARAGDILLTNFHGGKDPEHCGLVIEAGDGWIRTIEGNTSNGGSQDNGGAVCEKVRVYRQVVAVLRPQYKDEPETDWEGHWAAEHIRRAIDHGIMTGYEDGTFRPDRDVTRAELAVILDRLGLLD